MFLSNKCITLISVVLLFISAATVHCQKPSEAKNYTILGVSVQGNTYADEQTIITLSGLRPGDQITLPDLNKLSRALRSLWQKRQFSDVEVLVDKIIGDGIMLTIKVAEYPRLNKILIRNNKELKDLEIKTALGLSRGDIISPFVVYKAIRSLKLTYEKEGLMYAKIENELVPVDSGLFFDLSLWIEEGTNFHVASIEFFGSEHFSDGDIADAFKDTKTKWWFEFWSSDKFDIRKYEEDKKLIKPFFKKNGFIDGELLRDTVIYDEEKKKVFLKLWVNEGKKIYIRNVDFIGNIVYPAEYLAPRLDFQKGMPYNVESFDMNLYGNEDQTDVSSVYLNNGYLQAQFTKEEKRIGEDSIDIIIKVIENKRIKVRKNIIEGNNKTKDKVIRRELYTMPGDYFNRAAIIRSIRALGALNYFNPEALKPDVKPVGTGRDFTEVDLVYHVEEQSTDMINASIGFAGSFGLTGAVGFTLNNFSLSEPFFGGGGQMLNFNAEFGQANRYQTFSLGFAEPWLFDEPISVGFNLYYTWLRWTYNLRRVGAMVNLGRRLRWPDDYFRIDGNFRVQENLVEGTSGYYYREGLSTEVTLGGTISRSSLDHPFFPANGSRFSLSGSWAMAAVGLGTTDYFKTEMNYEMLAPLMKIDEMDRVVLYLKTSFGYVSGFKTDTTIPPIELYYMGGSGLSGFGVTPMRGYDDRAIGPTYGGGVQTLHTAELRFALSLSPMPVYFYGFAEAGNVWNNLKQTDPFDLKRSAGVGVQVLLNPIGIIGFSYGYGFDIDDKTGLRSGWTFLFHLGQR